MNQENMQPTNIQDGTVVTLDYTLTVNGEVIDHSSDSGPIQFLQGHGHIIPGLESALYGMAAGESRQVVVSPKEGYGEEDEEAYAEIPLSEFSHEIPIEVGVQLHLRDQDGDEFEAYIEEIGEESVMLNFNHPLAGKELYFAVTVVELRHASEEELEHGHVHFEDEEE